MKNVKGRVNNVSTKKSGGLINTIVKRIMPCDCYLFKKTPLTAFRGKCMRRRLFICKECGRAKFVTEESRLVDLYINRTRNLL